LAGRVLEEALSELEARLAGQPNFYRGSSALVNFGDTLPSAHELQRLRSLLSDAGIALRGVAGSAEGLAGIAELEALSVEPPASLLSASARSLVADFAGARNDIAARRKRGETSVRRAKVEPQRAPELRLVEAPPVTLLHKATLRGGQTLHHTGNIVVVGDVNPGAELVATGDVLVFGRLAGTAHAGAQGDATACICAIELAATQLRIATFIAAEDDAERPAGGPEAAVARDGAIAIIPLAELDRAEPSGASSA
jgi:septum site-determining protein MinC